jgi:hypothetical protein
MADWRAKWQQVVTDLERQRDELRVRIHLARADTRDEWDRINLKLDQLRQRAQSAGSEAKGAMKDIGEAAERLAEEVRQGLDRVRKTL